MATISLTACSRRNDTGWHRTTPDDTGRHVEPGSVPGRSNLRIRCPKGHRGSTPLSRTPSDLRILAQAAPPTRTPRTRLAHACSQRSREPWAKPRLETRGPPPMTSQLDPTRCGALIVVTKEGDTGRFGRCKSFSGNHREGTSAEFIEALPLLLVNLRQAHENEGYLAAHQ
jgi:hypothetical protein